MATKHRPVGELTLDNPDADGQIDELGWGYTWRFGARPKQDPTAEWRFGEQTRWDMDGCEIVPPLNALSILGHSYKAAMTLGAGAGEWTVSGGSQGTPGNWWREEKIAARPTVQWASYFDSNADQWGKITSVDDMAPSICAWIIRNVPPPGQTGPCWATISLLGDDSVAADQVAYAVTLPIWDTSAASTEGPGPGDDATDQWQRWKHPLLWRYYGGDPSPAWAIVDEWPRADTQGDAWSDTVKFTGLWWETTDGIILIRMPGVADWWVYDPEDSDLAPQTGKVECWFVGQAGAVNIQSIAYPAGEWTADSVAQLTVPAQLEQTAPSTHQVTGGGGSVGTTTIVDDAGPPAKFRVRFTLDMEGGTDRPVVYAGHQYRAPSFNAARSTPYATDGRNELIELKWVRQWPFGWSFRARLRDPSDYWLAKVHEQGKVTVRAGWDTSADTTVMIAYLDEPILIRDANNDLVREVVLSGRDLITARLSQHTCLWRVSPEGWNLKPWLTWMLECAEVRASQQNIDAAGDAIAIGRSHKKREWQFGHDTPLITAIDEVLAYHEWAWATESDGKIWAGPRAVYAGGAVDYTIDEAGQDADSVITRIDSRTDRQAFRNMAFVTLDPYDLDGGNFGIGLSIDDDSHHTPADEHFRGCLLPDVRVEPHVGEPGDETAWDDRADEIVEQRLRQGRVLRWQTIGQPALEPGDYIAVDEVSDINVPAGTVFRIRRDTATLNPDAKTFRRTFRLEHCAEWAPP